MAAVAAATGNTGSGAERLSQARMVLPEREREVAQWYAGRGQYELRGHDLLATGTTEVVARCPVACALVVANWWAKIPG